MKSAKFNKVYMSVQSAPPTREDGNLGNLREDIGQANPRVVYISEIWPNQDPEWELSKCGLRVQMAGVVVEHDDTA